MSTPDGRSAADAVLLLLTAGFPYGAQETFLEEEIDYLARSFERIVVFPSHTVGKARSLPVNVTVDPAVAVAHRRSPRPLRPVLGLLTPAFWREMTSCPSTCLRPGAMRRLAGYAGAEQRAAIGLRRSLRRCAVPPERILIYSYWLASAAGAAGRIRSEGLAARSVSRAHGVDLYHERHTPPYIPLQDRTVAGLDAVFTVSDHGGRYLRARHPDAEVAIEVERLGVADPGRLSTSSPDLRLRVVSCSNLFAVKRVQLIVEALAHAAAAAPDLEIEWHHFGDGYEQDEVCRRARERLAERVIWRMHGRVPNERVLHWYGSHPVDVFVNVSESEGVPVSVMEAMSFGVPIVATAVGGTPEIVTPENGVLLPRAAGAAAIGDALLTLRPGSMDVARMRAKSRKLFEERCSAERHYTRFSKRLRQLLEASSLAPRSGTGPIR